MCNSDPKKFTTAEIPATSACTDAASAPKSSRSLAGFNPTGEGHGRVRIVTPDHRLPAADHFAEVVSLTMRDATDGVIWGFDCMPSEERGIRAGRREYAFVSSGAGLSIPDAAGPSSHA